MTTIFHEDIVRVVRDHAAGMEHTGKLTPEILEFIYQEKLFKLFVPTELEGLMVDLPEALRIFEQASWVDGSFGWLITIGSGGGFFAATLPSNEAALLYTHRKAVVAGSGHPNGKATLVDGGYQVSGQWKYCSGSTYASLFTANCIIKRGDEQEIRSFVFMPEQVEIIQDWKALGLKVTESHSIAVKDVFVPDHLTFSIASEPNYKAPVYQYPFLQFAQTSFAAVCAGIGQHFLEEARSEALTQQEKWESKYPTKFPAVMSKLNEKEAIFRDAVQQFYVTIESSWSRFVSNQELSEQDQHDVSFRSQEIARIALESAHTLFPLLGMTVLMEDNLLNRIWRDLHTVTQHGVLVAID
ncbi:Flavin-dependent monooxygenase, oxygenase subunit HsaA [compost metagenome]